MCKVGAWHFPLVPDPNGILEQTFTFIFYIIPYTLSVHPSDHDDARNHRIPNDDDPCSFIHLFMSFGYFRESGARKPFHERKKGKAHVKL